MRRSWTALLTGALLLVGAACGGSSSSTTTTTAAASTSTRAGAASTAASDGTTSSAAASDPVAAARQRVSKLLQPATSIGLSTKLTAKPTPGKTVYWLEGNIQSILPITDGFKESTQAVGWNLKVLSYDPSNPQAPSAAMNQAVDANADYIVISGQTISILGQALDNAKAKKIPVIDMYSTDDVKGAENGIYGNVGGPAFSRTAESTLVDFIIADSDAKASTLFVNIPDFAILQVVADAVKTSFKGCPNCKLTPLDVSISDLTSGKVASLVTSALQSNPDINYVLVSIGDLATGLPQALSAAGQKPKIVGGVPNTEQVQQLIDKEAAAYIPLGRPMSAWYALDVALRLDQKMDPLAKDHELLPYQIWTPDNVPKPAQDYQGAQNYQGQFKGLWNLSP